MKFTTWNATTLKNNYRTDILTDEFGHLELNLFGVSETYISGIWNLKLSDKKVIYSAGKDGVHRKGYMVNKEAVKTCLGWKVLMIECQSLILWLKTVEYL